MSEDEEIAELEPFGIVERDKPPFVRLPDPQSQFAARATRFAALASGHQLGPYLIFLGELSKIQDRLAKELADPAMPSLSDLRIRAGNAMPLVPREDLVDELTVYESLARLLDLAGVIVMPDAARAALIRAKEMDHDARRSMVATLLSDVVPVETVAEHIFGAAALQVIAAKRSALLDAKFPQAVANGVCPCCGGPPVTSTVVTWANIEGARYVQCSLCATRWNHVRVKCVSCGSTKGIAYHQIEGVADTIKAETCDECRTYVKIIYQHKDPDLEPVADDVASLGLDLLVTEAGWRRAGVNPFLLGY